jgi:formate hydrogenlyase subunit 3/multisubunit Na+/H+ antiporter MnhD subunit
MMALIQHNYKRLLGYHAVSQVGYMVLGLSLGTPLGIAGGLFHMLNNAIYKSGLFLSAGNVEQATGEEEIGELGGLSRAMPITFVSALICALAISGIPPLNGFASKWLIYQGIIDFGREAGAANSVWFVWLGLAVLGSALTLASFIKFTSGIFLGGQRKELKGAKEVNLLMWLPTAILAIACLVIGIFASLWVIPKIIMPLYGEFEYIGIWQSSSVSLLILVGIILGILIYFIGNARNFRTDESFIGGEKNQDEAGFSVLGFYKTIRDFRLLSVIYEKAEKKWFDLYEVCRKVIEWLGVWISKAHTGILTMYALWIFVGVVLLLIILFQI